MVLRPVVDSLYFNAQSPHQTSTLSLHAALPIWTAPSWRSCRILFWLTQPAITTSPDRKSTRLNSSHLGISYAVFCLKKKKRITLEGCNGAQARDKMTSRQPGITR